SPSMCPTAAPGPACTLSLRCSSSKVPEVDTLVGRTAMKTQVQVLVITFLHRIDNLLRHARGKGQVATYLPYNYGCSNVPGLNLHVLARNLLHHSQGVRSMPITAVFGTVSERSWQFIGLSMIHLLVYALLEVLKDDCQLQDKIHKRHIMNILQT
uniref:Uncharacterized protein n=1 Tax=Anabas testudineus TaxID=64144 RepID=A0A3Q1HJ26_ANATE